MSVSRIRRAYLLALVASLSVLAVAPTARAGSLTSAVASCDYGSYEQPFAQFADPSNYVLTPGGSFENSNGRYALAGGASVVSGNETFYVGGVKDGRSLALPDGSSATSSSLCADADGPTLRLFVRNTGSPLSTLKVEVLAEDPVGNVVTAPIGVVAAGGAWQPTDPMAVGANLFASLGGGKAALAFRFTPQGSGGSWQIDDVYLDPWARR